MKPSNETTFFVAAPGSTEYEPLQRGELVRRLDAQQLSWSQQIWCPDAQEWKKAREVRRLAPAIPSPQPTPSPQPRVAVAVAKPVVATPQVAVVKAATPAPAVAGGTTHPVQARAAVAQAKPVPKARSPRAAVIRSAAAPAPVLVTRPSFFRSQTFLYEALTLLLVVGLVAMNRFGANAPIQKAIVESGLEGKARANAHCGFYVQPTALVVNITKLPEDFNRDQFIDLITTFAFHRPASPLFGMGWGSVTLQKDGKSRFTFRGDTWKRLAQMKGGPVGRRAMLIVDGLYDATGQPVMNQKEDRMEFLIGEKNKALHNFLGAYIKLTEKKAPPPTAAPEVAPAAAPAEIPTETAP